MLSYLSFITRCAPGCEAVSSPCSRRSRLTSTHLSATWWGNASLTVKCVLGTVTNVKLSQVCGEKRLQITSKAFQPFFSLSVSVCLSFDLILLTSLSVTVFNSDARLLRFSSALFPLSLSLSDSVTFSGSHSGVHSFAHSLMGMHQQPPFSLHIWVLDNLLRCGSQSTWYTRCKKSNYNKLNMSRKVMVISQFFIIIKTQRLIICLTVLINEQ